MTKSAQQEPGSVRQQFETLTALGLQLRSGVTLEDVLAEHDDEEYEENPYGLLLTMLARTMGRDGEPDPDGLATNVGALDLEFVEDSDAYEVPIRYLAAATGRRERLTEVSSDIDFENEEGTVSYVINGQRRTWDLEVQAEWADPTVLRYALDDLVSPDAGVASFNDSQTFGFVVVDPGQGKALQKLLDTWVGG